jgi:hypothetical protein
VLFTWPRGEIVEDGLRRWTYHTLFGLNSVTGMRLSEAMNLEHGASTWRLAC